MSGSEEESTEEKSDSSTEYKTMRVPESDWKVAKNAKKDDETWGDYLRRCSENPPEIKRFVEADEVVKQVGGKIDDLSADLNRLFDRFS